MAAPRSGTLNGCSAVWVGKVMVSVTFVSPALAGTVAGVNVAVAPGGRPLTVKVMGPDSVASVGGLIAKEYVACPPGEDDAQRE